MKDNTKTQQRIQEMKGKRFQYRNYNVLLEDVQVRGTFYLFDFKHVNGNPLKIEKDFTQVDLFLEGLTPITEIINNEEASQEITPTTLPAVNNNFQPAILKENRDLLISLKNMLVSDMQKVREDKTYIPQAKQACNTANSIINLARLEILMLRSE